MAAVRACPRFLRLTRRLHTRTPVLQSQQATSGGSGYADFSQGSPALVARASSVRLQTTSIWGACKLERFWEISGRALNRFILPV
jgi:hypothetical protein